MQNTAQSIPPTTHQMLGTRNKNHARIFHVRKAVEVSSSKVEQADYVPASALPQTHLNSPGSSLG